MIRELAEILLVLLFGITIGYTLGWMQLFGITIGYTLGWMHERWNNKQLKKNV